MRQQARPSRTTATTAAVQRTCRQWRPFNCRITNKRSTGRVTCSLPNWINSKLSDDLTAESYRSARLRNRNANNFNNHKIQRVYLNNNDNFNSHYMMDCRIPLWYCTMHSTYVRTPCMQTVCLCKYRKWQYRYRNIGIDVDTFSVRYRYRYRRYF